MKVPIDDEDAKTVSAPDDTGEAKAPLETEAPNASAKDEPDDVEGAVAGEEDPEAVERARVEAAIRAGEQAAEEDFKADADKLRQERDELQKRLDGVADEVAEAKKQAADATERLVRLQADWDNFRRRTAQERLAEKERAAEKLVVSLLPVLDDMERACSHAAENNADDAGVMQFVEGVEAIHDKMYAALNKEGVEVIDPAGQPFDPMVHQAVGREEDTEAFDETVAKVYQRGYRMGDKVIRSAMVTVSFGGPKRPAPEPGADITAGDATEEGPGGDAEGEAKE